MSNKDRVCVELFHRDEHSIGNDNRQRHGLAIYHWAILIKPKDIRSISNCTSYDTTDAALPTTDRAQNLNPDGEWRFRIRSNVSPLNTGHFLVAVVLGKLPKNFTKDRITAVLAQTPLPQKGHTPAQNCVTWTRYAIVNLQRAGVLDDSLDVRDIMKVAFQKADLVMRDGPPRNVTDRFVDLEVLRNDITTTNSEAQGRTVLATASHAASSRSAIPVSTASLAAEAASAKAAFLKLKQQNFSDDQAFELLVREYMKRNETVSREMAAAGIRGRLQYQG